MSKIKQRIWDSVICSARELFLKKSIEEVSISEIAINSGVGEATIYRYFKKKSNLAYEIALNEWEQMLISIKELKSDSGYDRISKFYNLFLDTFINHKNFYSFLYEFDHFVLSIDNFDKSRYERILLDIKMEFIEAYKMGISDNSIKEINDLDLFYYSTTHALLSLCMKLSCFSLIESDNKYCSSEIKTLIDIILFRIR